MHAELYAMLSSRGFVTRPQILRSGLDDRSILDWKRSGEIIRVGPGLYASASYQLMSPEQKHVLRARAVATRMGSRVAFTHQTAVLLHGLPVHGVDLARIHVSRLDGGRGRRDKEVVHHEAELLPEDLAAIPELVVTTPTRAVWDLATAESAESTIVTADAALRAGLTDDDRLVQLAVRHGRWRGSRRAKVALSLTDRQAESPAESLARYAFHQLGLPRPTSQHKIFDATRTLLAVADFAFERERLVVEIDGMVKYGSGADLAREKRREDSIRALGWGVTRLTWDQLRPEVRPALDRTLREALDQSRRQFGHLAA